ncbi:GIY-YIG nuclease family protein [Microbacterium sp. BLY]|uniref:GIY-YIG nuclease family protein n=1 Tax=Microbacterium sp. BLY TaxID=2823280 RepID=UPI001FF0DD8A|nr:GIY-YIG nuclease family protein [Microbacterium sp. BLY]
MPWTYILECRDGSFYTGSTNGDLEARVWEHNNDDAFGSTTTTTRSPRTSLADGDPRCSSTRSTSTPSTRPSSGRSRSRGEAVGRRSH